MVISLYPDNSFHKYNSNTVWNVSIRFARPLSSIKAIYHCTPNVYFWHADNLELSSSSNILSIPKMRYCERHVFPNSWNETVRTRWILQHLPQMASWFCPRRFFLVFLFSQWINADPSASVLTIVVGAKVWPWRCFLPPTQGRNPNSALALFLVRFQLERERFLMMSYLGKRRN